MSNTEQRRLFVASGFDGLLACAHCEGVYFPTMRGIRGLISLLQSRNTPVPTWLDETKERECRRQHGEEHIKRGEALRTADGVYILP